MYVEKENQVCYHSSLETIH